MAPTQRLGPVHAGTSDHGHVSPYPLPWGILLLWAALPSNSLHHYHTFWLNLQYCTTDQTPAKLSRKESGRA